MEPALPLPVSEPSAAMSNHIHISCMQLSLLSLRAIQFLLPLAVHLWILLAPPPPFSTCVFAGEKPKMICGCEDPDTMKLWLNAFKDVASGGATPRATGAGGGGGGSRY